MGCLEAGSYAAGGLRVYVMVCRNLCPDAINRAAIFVARKSIQSITPARRKTRLGWLVLEGGEASRSIALLVRCAAYGQACPSLFVGRLRDMRPDERDDAPAARLTVCIGDEWRRVLPVGRAWDHHRLLVWQ